MDPYLLLSLLALSSCYTAGKEQVDMKREEFRREMAGEIKKLLMQLREHDEEDHVDKSRDLLTYNLAMTPSIPHYETRRQALGKFMSELDADVVCLQEIFYIRDLVTILDNIPKEYLFSYSFVHTNVLTLDAAIEAPCDDAEAFSNVVQCTITECLEGELGHYEALACSALKCGLLTLRQDCVSCLVISSGNHEYSEKCLSTDGAMNAVGLLVLSKEQPVSFRRELYDMHAAQAKLFQRGYLELEFPEAQTIFCTHLTADFGPMYVEKLRYGSFKKQQAAEIDKLLCRIGIEHGDSVIMGTMNTGPKATDLTNYNKLISHHFTNALGFSRCTRCQSNPLLQQCEWCDKSEDAQIDMVLLHGHYESSNAKLVFYENIKDRNYPLSDHYGITATVSCDEEHDHRKK